MLCVSILDLIDNLGVGFYSAFLVAQKVIITSQYNDLGQYIWESQPDASFIVTKDIKAQHLSRGTKITLFLKDDQVHNLTFPPFSCYFLC